MRHLTPGLLSVLALAACGSSDDAPAPQDSVAPATAAVTSEPSPAPVTKSGTPHPSDQEAFVTWLNSDTRPVNLACMGENYSRGQSETQIMLHSPRYPAIEAKSERLKQDLRGLVPQVTDQDMHDAEGFNAVKHRMSALAQWTFVSGQDLIPHYLMNLCNVALYEDDQCQIGQRVARNQVTLSDFARDGEALSYAAQYAGGEQATLFLSNRDHDHVKLNLMTPEGNYQGEWQRADDGTEMFSSIGPEGQFSYTERPDCSGEARATRTDASGHPWSWSWTWTPVTTDNFQMTFSECKTNGLDEELCTSDGL